MKIFSIRLRQDLEAVEDAQREAEVEALGVFRMSETHQ